MVVGGTWVSNRRQGNIITSTTRENVEQIEKKGIKSINASVYPMRALFFFLSFHATLGPGD